MIKNAESTHEKDYDMWKQKLTELFAPNQAKEKCFVSLSVRSALDCFLQVRKYPRGTEVLMTAINIPDMVQIFNEHGLVPIPVDIDPYTMSPSLEAV